MPDIFKQRGGMLSEERVAIPDVAFRPPEPEPPMEPELEEREEREELEDDPRPPAAPPPPPPPPQPAFTPAVMTREELTAYYHDDLEQLRQEAVQRGYAEALSRKKGELIRCLDEADQVLAQLQQQQTAYMEAFSRELKYMALEIAEKMICAKIDEHDETLSKLVLQTVTSVKTASWIDVELSERLVSLVDAIQRELERAEYHGRAVVSPRAVPDDTVRVTTEDGTVVATISTQAENLREAFQTTDQSVR